MAGTGRRFGVAVGLLAILIPLAGCAQNDADIDDVVEAMREANLSEEQAECVGRGFEGEDFGQDTLNDIASASDPDEYPEGTREPITSILERCTSEGGDDAEGGQETTTTTTAAGN